MHTKTGSKQSKNKCIQTESILKQAPEKSAQKDVQKESILKKKLQKK